MKEIEKYGKAKIRQNWRRRLTGVLAGVIVFTMTYSLVLPAVTLDESTATDDPGIVLNAAEETSEKISPAAETEEIAVSTDEPKDTTADETESIEIEATNAVEPDETEVVTEDVETAVIEETEIPQNDAVPADGSEDKTAAPAGSTEDITVAATNENATDETAAPAGSTEDITVAATNENAAVETAAPAASTEDITAAAINESTTDETAAPAESTEDKDVTAAVDSTTNEATASAESTVDESVVQVESETEEAAADVESASDWDAMFANVTLTGDWAEDLLAVANTQIGYTESAENTVIDENGEVKGYTRYGAKYELPYSDWNALFVQFCMEYAGIPEDAMPEMIEVDDAFIPLKGDLVYFNQNDSTLVGIVSDVDQENAYITVLVGDLDNSVQYAGYKLNDSSILGFGLVLENPNYLPAQDFEAQADDVKVIVNAPEGAFPAGTTMTVELVEDEEILTAAAAAVEEATKDEVHAVKAVDIVFYNRRGEAIEPQAAVRVSMSSAVVKEAEAIEVVHVDNEGTAEVVSQAEDVETAEDEVVFEADGFSVYVIVGTETITTKVITASGETYEISVTYGADAEIPNGASLKAEEILEGGEEYESYYEKTLMVLQEQATDENYLAGLDFARFFDVTIYDSEGTKIEPKAPVEVKITYVDPLEVADHAELKVVHFADQGTEIIDIDNQEQSVSEIVYEQSGFSVIGTVGATDAYGWPQGNDNPYVVILQSGDSYYAVAHDGTLKEVHYLNETVSFMGQGTTTLDYLDDYLWDYTVVSSTRHTATLSTSGEDTPAYIDPVYGVLPGNPDTLISPAQRTLYINNGQIYATYYGTRYTLSAEGGELNRTTVDASDASPILFAPRSSFMANSSDSEDYDYIDIETLIEEWKRQMTQDLVVDKTAEVVDYENRIYEVDLAASSGYHLVTPALALEFVVDASRSMYFPENLYEHATYNGIQGLRNWINQYGDTSQTYYVITDPNNKATNYTIYYNTRLRGWYVVDAAYHHAPDGVNQDGTALNQWSRNEEYDGKIYISDEKIEGQPWCRLDYMKLAVSAAARVLFAIDPSAQIGLVSFNAEDHAYGPFTQTGTEQYSAGDVQALINALNNISLAGGTEHDKGLNRAVTEFRTKFHQITNCQAAVVLITDGAPNGTTWQNIRSAANSVKNMTNAYGQNTRLFTLGLSLEHIGNNKQELANIATDASHAFNAEKSSEVVSFLTKIIEGLVVDANLKGNVTDVIDAAFYPVNPNTGMPLESGTWITLEGRVTTQGAEDAAGKVIKEGNTWKVEWNDQLITWSDSNTGKHGWNGRIYLKAQEDFLGGNDINTNASGSQAEAIEYINPRTQEHVVISSDDAEKIKEFDTPYVNVDELAINENSTEWTVYLGESVDPRTELEELLDLVQIYEVVKEDGSLVYTYTPGSTTNPTNKATTGVAIDLDEFLGILTEDDWDALIAGDPIETEYKAYGHTPGSIWVTLTQEVVNGEDDLTPSPHNTAVVGEEVEKYTLTVTYEPYDASVADYHTGNNITGSHGADTDEMVSENIHIINVFAKGMQITKTDQEFVKELTGAKFVLYRTARNGDDQSKVTPIEGATGNYYPVAELDLSSIASGTINPVEKLAEGERYYLVETQAPTGYYPLDHPIPVTLEITNSYVPKPGDQSQQTKPTSGIYDWTQTAVLNVPAATDSAVKRTDRNNTVDLTHTVIDPDSENTILYFRIANSTGYELPNTGGSGTLPYSLGGIAMIMAAALMYVFRMRRRERSLN